MDDVEEKVMPTEPEPKSKMVPVPKKSDIPEIEGFLCFLTRSFLSSLFMWEAFCKAFVLVMF